MPRNAANSAKAERDQLRDRMRGLGATIPQIATEMTRRFHLRPRLAWRYALGWPQWKLAQVYNTLHPGAKLSDNRVSEYEAWPHGGATPSPRYLARLAATYGHGCTPAHLVDADDLQHLTPADRTLLTTGHPPGGLTSHDDGTVRSDFVPHARRPGLRRGPESVEDFPATQLTVPSTSPGCTASGKPACQPFMWAFSGAWTRAEREDVLFPRWAVAPVAAACPGRAATRRAWERDAAAVQPGGPGLLPTWAHRAGRRGAGCRGAGAGRVPRG